MNEKIGKKEKKVYISLYKKDAASYALILLAAVAEFVYVISILDSMPVSFWMGATVMVNILLLFMLFTCAVKVNAYHKGWAALTLALGFYTIFRQLVLVPYLLKPFDRETVILIANLIQAGLLSWGGVTSLKKIKRRSALEKRIAAEKEQMG